MSRPTHEDRTRRAYMDADTLGLLVRGEVARILDENPERVVPLRTYTALSAGRQRAVWAVRTGPANLDVAFTREGEEAFARLRLPVQAIALLGERTASLKVDVEELADGTTRTRRRKRVAGIGRTVVLAGPLPPIPVHPFPEQAYRLMADLNGQGARFLTQLDEDPPEWDPRILVHPNRVKG